MCCTSTLQGFVNRASGRFHVSAPLALMEFIPGLCRHCLSELCGSGNVSRFEMKGSGLPNVKKGCDCIRLLNVAKRPAVERGSTPKNPHALMRNSNTRWCKLPWMNNQNARKTVLPSLGIHEMQTCLQAYTIPTEITVTTFSLQPTLKATL